MYIKQINKNRKDRFSRCKRHEGETEVQSGLSMTPAQMYEMAQKGLPITARNLGVIYDEGYSQLEFEPPLEYTRGVDLADAWEARQDAKSKLRRMKKSGRFDPIETPKVEPNKTE